MPEGKLARLTFVTGKGGVGKSSVAAGIARSAVSAGHRTLAVDVEASGRLRDLLATDVDSLSVLDLTTEASVDEYVQRYLKVPIAPSNVPVLAKIFDFVSTAAPAVREILTIGKIGFEAVEGGWDRIVVDGPATGHVVELLTAPENLRQLAPSGPLATQTDWLGDVASAPSTDLVVVSQAEELIVNETRELLDRIHTATETRVGAIVANRVPQAIGKAGNREAMALSSGEGALAAAAELILAADARRERFGPLLGAMASESGAACITIDERPNDPVGAVVDAVERSLLDGRWK